MFKEKIKQLETKKEGNNKKKIENIMFLVIILIATIIFLNMILKDDIPSSKIKKQEDNEDQSKVLATNTESNSLEENLKKILATIKGVGEVNVFINYSESSKTIAMYDEKTTVSTTEENDSTGGIRNTTSTETQKDVVFSDTSGTKNPVTEKIVMPVIEGAIITAKGASDVNVKKNILVALQAATGLSIDKIQVFEME